MKNFLYLGLISIALTSCSHTVRLPINNFATPVSGNGGFEGHISATYEESAKVSFVQDPFSATPIHRADYGDSSSLDIIEDSLVLPKLGYFIQISPVNSIDIYRDSGVWGAKWQFIGHKQSNTLAVSVQAGYGSYSDKTEQTLNNNTDFAISDHDIKQLQYGFSAGYVWTKHVAYVSLIRNDYDVDTNLKNRHGDWAFNNKGNHTNASIGLSSLSQGLEYGFEYTYQMADWKDSDGTESALGVKLGYRWK